MNFLIIINQKEDGRLISKWILGRRNVEVLLDSSVSEWFHMVGYCVDGNEP
jgi:hypothetical protein